MITIARYSQADQQAWDSFVAAAKNAVFLFQRAYMEYHRDRFVDHSLLILQEDRLLAVLAANVKEDVLYSHGGLTFGGIVCDQRMKTSTMLEIFTALRGYLASQGIRKVVYKPVPHIYHMLPAEEDLYALFIHGARLMRRDVSSTIFMQERLSLGKGRKWSAKQAKKSGLEVKQTQDFLGFMAIEEENLRKKYGTKPTHSGPELALLAGRFPDNIKLFGSYRQDTLVGGMVVYESKRVAHAQYIAATDEGRDLRALDGIVDVLLTETYASKPYFDFGISTENQGRYLNAGLIANKEGHGGRAIAYDFYEMEIDT